jgi:thiamine-phosphate pyrophosphorylase
MIRCAISNGSSSPAELLKAAHRWASERLDYIQLREPHLTAAALTEAARAIIAVLRERSPHTKLLLNRRSDIALASAADGVHLTSRPGELTPHQVRRIFTLAKGPTPLLSISCHTLADIERATAAGVDLILFGPVFEKRINGELVVPGVGLEILRQASVTANGTPVLALGGLTEKYLSSCLDVGAAGVAGIRLFDQE